MNKKYTTLSPKDLKRLQKAVTEYVNKAYWANIKRKQLEKDNEN